MGLPMRTMLVVGILIIGGPVLAQNSPVVPPPSLTPISFQQPNMLPGIPTSNTKAASPQHQPEGNGHSKIKDVTPSIFQEAPHSMPEAHWSHAPESHSGVYAFGEVLLMRPRRAAVDFAIVDGANDIIPRGKSEQVLYDTQPGFRVGLGYGFGDGWSLGGSYTYFRNSDERSINAPANGVIYPTLTRPGLVDTASAANASLRLEYNIFDLEMMKKVTFDDSLSVVWGGGLKFASIKQELTAAYNGRDANMALVSNINDFYGTGPSFGGEVQWNMGNGFGAYTKANGALLVGDLKTGLSEANNRGATVHADLQDEVTRVIPTLSIGLGLSYDFRGIKASVGYEVTNYFGLIQRSQFVDDFSEGKFATRGGDLSLDGFVFRLGYEY